MIADAYEEFSGPLIEVDIAAVENNARTIAGLCSDHGIEVTAVTKVTCGMPQVARALLRSGIRQLGESRLENIHRLRAGGISAPVMLLRIPPLSAAEEIVRTVDVSLNSELPVIRRLSEVALSLGTVHDVILMVDLGDLREGIWPQDLMSVVAEVRELEGVRIAGIGTNLTCYGGVIPSEKNLGQLVDYAKRIEDRFGFRIETISGGNSSTLELLAAGRVPKEINNLRIGEGILLGRETVDRRAWPGTSQKAFVLSAEIIEKKRKPSVPIGEIGQDAFGGKPVFEDRGEQLRGILNIGREDVDVDGLESADSRISVLGASSDHLIVDLSAVDEPPELGDRIRFIPNYSALLAFMTSGYVGKRIVLPEGRAGENRRRVALTGSLFAGEKYGDELVSWLDRLGYRHENLGDDAGAPQLAERITPGSIPVIGGRALGPVALEAAAKAMGQFGLLWVDSTVTGSELRRVLGRGADVPGGGFSGPAVHAEALALDNIVLLGVREIEPEAVELIRRYNIRTYTMEEVSLLPMREIVRRAISACASGTEGIYLKFAGRVADNGNDGLTNRETHLIMEMIAASGALRVFELDDDETGGMDSGYVRSSRDASANLPRFLLSALGKRILGV
jgi:predicted amino acid racemase